MYLSSDVQKLSMSLEVLTRLQVDPRFCHGQKEPNLLSCLRGSRRHPMPALMYIKYYQGGVRTGTLQKVGSKQKTHTYWSDKSKTLVAKAHPETQGDRKQRPSPRTPMRSHIKEGSSEGVGSPGRRKGQRGYLRERRESISFPPQVHRVQNPGKE